MRTVLKRELNIKRIGTFSSFLSNRSKRINILFGGAGSGKSFAVAQLFVERLLREHDVRMLVLRKTLPALRITAYRLILDLLREYELPFELNKSEMLIKAGTNEILFKSLDDPEKIKSFEANYTWLEEATELSYEDFTQLNLRLRRKNEKYINQMFLTFNPISRFHWINTKLIEVPREDVAIHHSNYKVNPFLDQTYRDELEGLEDENYYKIYTLGEFGELKNIIFSNYVVEDFGTLFFDEVNYGLDFGYNNPSAVVEVGWHDGEPYIKEKLYESHLTNQYLIERLKSICSPSAAIYADASEPARIEEISKAGFNIHPAEKSVKDGIDHLKSQKLHVEINSANLINELRSYKYKETKDGVILDEPVKFRDHLVDAMRYCIYTARDKSGLEPDGRVISAGDPYKEVYSSEPRTGPRIPSRRSMRRRPSSEIPGL